MVHLPTMQQRGQQKLFNDFFHPPEPVPGLCAVRTMGRDAERLKRRNTRLLHRYYWLGRQRIDGMRPSYDSILHRLDMEFDLSPSTIRQIIDKHYPQLQHLKERYHALDNNALTRHCAKQWPFMAWQ